MLAQLPPELHLACLLCRPTLSDAVLESARETVGSGLDWDCFLDFVLWQRIFPLVSQHASGALADAIPPRVRSELRAYAIANGKRADAMANELAAVLLALDNAAIRAVPLKGPVLIERIWGDSRLCVSHDLDILVKADEARRATDVLAKRDYHPDDTYLRGFPSWRFGSHSLPMVRSPEIAFTMRIDLHTAVASEWIRSPLGADSLWERLQRGEFRGAPIRLLPDDWNLLLVALHALGHSFQALRWAAELHGLMEICGATWPAVLNLAERLRVRDEVVLARKVCDMILGEEIVRPEAASRLLLRLAGGPFGPPPSRLADRRLQVAVRRRMTAKLAYLGSALFRPLPSDVAFLPLPSWLIGAYYLVRPIRLAMKYFLAFPLLTVWKRLSGRGRSSDDFVQDRICRRTPGWKQSGAQ